MRALAGIMCKISWWNNRVLCSNICWRNNWVLCGKHNSALCTMMNTIGSFMWSAWCMQGELSWYPVWCHGDLHFTKIPQNPEYPQYWFLIIHIKSTQLDHDEILHMPWQQCCCGMCKMSLCSTFLEFTMKRVCFSSWNFKFVNWCPTDILWVYSVINVLGPRKSVYDFIKGNIQSCFTDYHVQILLLQMLQDLTGDKSILAHEWPGTIRQQVIAWADLDVYSYIYIYIYIYD